MIFDLTDVKSFECLNKWNSDINLYTNSNIIKILVGNKKDISTNRKINFDEAYNFSKINGYQNYFEVSAKDSNGLDELFMFVAKMYIEKIENDKKNQENINDTKKIKLDKFNLLKKEKYSCC